MVQDSDEFCIMSLTPAAVGQIQVIGPASERIRAREGLLQRLLVAVSISYHTARMPLKKRLFESSVRWHGGELDRAALDQEREISAFIDSATRLSRYTAFAGDALWKYRTSPVYMRLAPHVRLVLRAILGDRLLWAHIRRGLTFVICRPFKRARYWYASGRDLDVDDPLHLSVRSTGGRRLVSETLFAADPATAVILGIGQSNIANEGDPNGLYAPRGEVYNFNFFDGKCYAAKDPLLGASTKRSNVLTRVGDLLIERGRYRRVLLVPIAHGGTYAGEWQPGGRMFPRLEWTLERLKQSRIAVTHILWQQGESEAAHRDPKPRAWMNSFKAMAGAIRRAGVQAPIYVAQCTVCRSEPNENSSPSPAARDR